MNFQKDTVNIITRFEDDKLLEGMAVVASLIRKFHDKKMFVLKDYVGYMGEKYIAVAVPEKTRFTPSILGLLRKIVLKLDLIGDVPVSTLARIAINELFGSEEDRYKIVIK